MKEDLSLAVTNRVIRGGGGGGPLKELLIAVQAGSGKVWTEHVTWIGDQVLSGDFVCKFRIESMPDKSAMVFGVTIDTTAQASNCFQQIDCGHQFSGASSNNSTWWKSGAIDATSSTGEGITGAILTFTRSGSSVTVDYGGGTLHTFTGISTADMYPMTTHIINSGSEVTLYDANGGAIGDTYHHKGVNMNTTLSNRI